tara:strand:+ start:792 stop:1721 length:930 start_codon:yes stop_codon:yes gene_type:complete
MILNKPKYWDKKIGIISILLFPITIIVLIINFLKKKLTISKKFNIPIICIGNIYVGGTGKTPTSIFLGNELKKLGRNPAILRKFYEAHADEYNLIKRYFNNLILNKSRLEGIKSKMHKFDGIILDDGFQDYTIKKDLNIICFNQNQMIGNGMVLPSGPLRESIYSLKRANIILINGERNIKFEDKIFKINKNLEFFYSTYRPINLAEFKNKRLLAIAGIGNPENFFNLIENNNLKIDQKIIFPDHYKISKTEMQKILKKAEVKNYQIIMTEKDFFKIEKYKFRNIKYLKILLEINEHEKFVKRINDLYN